MKRALQLGMLSLAVLTGSQVAAQGTAPGTAAKASATSGSQPWAFSLTVDGYIILNERGYASPVFTADREWLHLEARYDYENLRTGSLWLGYSFSVGKKLVLEVTPMVGGVFGRTTGIAPGCEASLTYKKLQISVLNEYVFDTGEKSGNFYYSWPELTYSPLDWLKVGIVAQRSKAFQTRLDTQRGFLVGVSHRKVEFTSYVFNAGWADPTVVLEVGYKF
jgi:hypothetical protein